MATPSHSSVFIASANTATEIAQAGTNGGSYQITAVNLTGTAANVTIASNSSTATIANAGTYIKNYSLPATGEPLILTGIVLTGSLYVNAESDTANAVTVSVMGYDK